MYKKELQHKYHHKTPGKKIRWKRNLRYILFFFVVSISIFWWWKHRGSQHQTSVIIEPKQNSEEIIQLVTTNTSENIETCTVSEGDIPADIFSDYGKFDANDTVAILNAAENIFDLTHLKIGQNLRFYFDNKDENRATRMEYDCNTEKKIVVEREGDDFTVREENIEYDVTEEVARGKINNFFYIDAMDAGLSEATVLEMADVFAFDVDFTTDIRVGDEFIAAYQKRKRNGKDASDGYILAAKFVNDGNSYYAYYFDNDGNGGYYDSEGHALERQFLKAPLSYRRISSGFTSARLHPITKQITAHYQVDYAAPVGTPVVAAAKGTVTQAGWAGGWGNIVRITHDNGYTTHYGHLSKFGEGIKSGTQVKQGQVIGYVGSTGWSTGPHLDYGIKHNGTPINPLTFVQPKGDPLGEEQMAHFEEYKKNYNSIL